jgi:hypothetical protein
LLKHSSCYILFVPAGVHEDALGSRLQTSREVIDVPIPALLSDCVAIGIFSRAKQVVTDSQIGTEATDADTSPDPVILASSRERPTCGRLAVLRQRDAKYVGISRNVVANPSAPSLGKLNVVSGC